MALIEGCKHSLEVSVPVEEIDQETDLVVTRIQRKVQLPGFRPGKAPASLVRTRFADSIRQDVLEVVLPKALHRRFEQEKLNVVGTPNITNLHFHQGEPVQFTAEFEVMPEISLGEYKGVEVPYAEPVVSEQDVDERIEQLRERKADYVNEDPRPLADGDYALVTLTSLNQQDSADIQGQEVMLQIAGPETLPAFTENLRGKSPGDVAEFDVTYPEDYGSEQLAGKTVPFRVELTAIRRKELPAVEDSFAQDLGDFQTVAELREAIRRTIHAERDSAAQRYSKDRLLDKLVDTHDFPLPQTFVKSQVQTMVERQLQEMTGRPMDVTQLKLDWDKLTETYGDRARRDVKASLLVEQIGQAEAIQVTTEEVDAELQRIAGQEKQPVAVVRKKLQENGALDRIAYNLRAEKTLQWLFDNSAKVDPPPPAPVETPESDETPAESNAANEPPAESEQRDS